MEFIDLKRDDGYSSLAVSDKHPDTLGVVGVLPHWSYIAPRNVAAAKRLLAWLTAWIARQEAKEKR